MDEKQNHEHSQAAKAHLVSLMQAGYPWHKAAVIAGLQISRSAAYRLVQAVQARGEAAFQDGRQGHPAKLREGVLHWLQAFCHAAPQMPSREVQAALQDQFGIHVSIGHLNRVRAHLGIGSHVERYESVLCAMREQQASLGALGEAISTFLKVTESYWPGLFHCYDVADLPRTNNELEHCFGSVRYSERRASGRRGAIAALVVRGPVRVLTALALRHQCFLPRALVLDDLEAWYSMREQLTFRREARRKQLRFRKDPAAYLAALEDILLKIGLPS